MEIQMLSHAEIKVLKKGQSEEIQRTPGGYPIFNTCPHTLIDLSNSGEAPTTENTMHTLSIKLPNGDYVTVCNIPYRDINDSDGCLDIYYHGSRTTKIIGLNPGGRDEAVKGKFYTLIYEK